MNDAMWPCGWCPHRVQVPGWSAPAGGGLPGQEAEGG